MARYNKIFAGPWRVSMPQAMERPAAVDLLPGSAVVNTNEQFALASDTTTSKVWFVQDNYLVLNDTSVAIPAGQVAVGIEGSPELLVNVRVATGNDLKTGDALTPGAAGVLVKAALSDFVVAVAAETYNNNTGTDQLVQVRPVTGYITPAA